MLNLLKTLYHLGSKKCVPLGFFLKGRKGLMGSSHVHVNSVGKCLIRWRSSLNIQGHMNCGRLIGDWKISLEL